MEENKKPTEKKKPGRKAKYVYLDKFERSLEGLTLVDQKIAETCDKNIKLIATQVELDRKRIKAQRYVIIGIIAIYLGDILLRLIF